MIGWTIRCCEGKWFVPDVTVQRRDAIQSSYSMLPIYLCAVVLSVGERIGQILKKGAAHYDWGVPYFGVFNPDTRQP